MNHVPVTSAPSRCPTAHSVRQCAHLHSCVGSDAQTKTRIGRRLAPAHVSMTPILHRDRVGIAGFPALLVDGRSDRRADLHVSEQHAHPGEHIRRGCCRGARPRARGRQLRVAREGGSTSWTSKSFERARARAVPERIARCISRFHSKWTTAPSPRRNRSTPSGSGDIAFACGAAHKGRRGRGGAQRARRHQPCSCASSTCWPNACARNRRLSTALSRGHGTHSDSTCATT